MPGATLKISKSKLLLVEGKDEISFFTALLKKLNKEADVQIIEVGGKDNFKFELPAILNTTGFSENVKSLAIVRDADNNFDGAFQSVQNLLRRNHQIAPYGCNKFTMGDPKIGIYIMPDNFQNGMLEDLCLKTQENNPIMECVNAFFDCLSTKPIDQPKNLSKAKSQVFLAAMPDIVSSVGVGALNGYWNLDDPCLYSLLTFLENL